MSRHFGSVMDAVYSLGMSVDCDMLCESPMRCIYEIWDECRGALLIELSVRVGGTGMALMVIILKVHLTSQLNNDWIRLIVFYIIANI